MSFQSINLYKKLQKQYSRRINLDLTRIKKVLKVLNHPELDLKNPLNIIGSDGKMSVLTSLKFFLEANNKKVSTFISPHLKDVRERFYFNKKLISIKELKNYLKKIKKTKIKLTLFECLTACYVLAASKRKYLDYNLVESGLFFSKDSTRLWKNPRAVIVTNINKQHLEWLKKKTLTQICEEKLSKISQNTVIYISNQKPKTLKLIKIILKKNSSKKIYFSNWKILIKNNKYFYKDKKNFIPIRSNLIFSKALVDNLGLAIRVALDFGVTKELIKKTIPKIKFEGRVQYINKGRLKNLLNRNEKLLVDGCHSETSAKNLYDYLKTLKVPIYGIWGMKNNKSPELFLKTFKKVFKKIVTINIPNEPNALKTKTLSNIAKSLNYETLNSFSVKDALLKISNNNKKVIVIFGSLYLVGDALRKN